MALEMMLEMDPPRERTREGAVEESARERSETAEEREDRRLGGAGREGRGIAGGAPLGPKLLFLERMEEDDEGVRMCSARRREPATLTACWRAESMLVKLEVRRR